MFSPRKISSNRLSAGADRLESDYNMLFNIPRQANTVPSGLSGIKISGIARECQPRLRGSAGYGKRSTGRTAAIKPVQCPLYHEHRSACRPGAHLAADSIRSSSTKTSRCCRGPSSFPKRRLSPIRRCCLTQCILRASTRGPRFILESAPQVHLPQWFSIYCHGGILRRSACIS